MRALTRMSARAAGGPQQDERTVNSMARQMFEDLAAAYESFDADELEELIATLEPLATLLLAAQDR